MDNETKAEIDKLGLQEFPQKTVKKFERPIPLPEQIERITVREGAKQEQYQPRAEESTLSEGGSQGELAGIVSQGQVFFDYQQREKEIDKILSEGLEDIYLKMSPEKQREFKSVGEETVQLINQMMSQSKIKLQKIVDLIRGWLSIIPGVNKFFLEQEAKIRTDKILKLRK